MLRWICAPLALAAMACGGDDSAGEPRQSLSGTRVETETGENRPPQIDYVALGTDQPRTGAEIEARFDAADADRDALTFSVTWLRNGKVEQSGSSRSWTPSVLEKGDRIELRVVANDGQADSAPAVASTRIGNTSPVISELRVEPSTEPKRGEPLLATAIAYDSDGDEVEYRYQWLLNGKLVRGAETARFVSNETRRGDKLRVRAVASDGEDESTPVGSPELTLVNSPPAFAKFDGFEPSGGMFRHQFRASDPDGDSGLRFALKQGPRGMEVDPVLGIATWHPGADAKGVIPVQVEVRDAYGASSALAFEITIGGGESAAEPATAPAAQAEGESP